MVNERNPMSFVKMFNIDGFYVTCMYKMCVFVKILYSEIYLISVTIGETMENYSNTYERILYHLINI